MSRLILKNVNLVDGVRAAVADQVVVVEDGVVLSVGPTTGATRPDDDLVDLAGRTVRAGPTVTSSPLRTKR
jgi:imidazolonepropionase-like amidohydrolase